MHVPIQWREYPCADYFNSSLADQGWWDDSAQCWYTERSGDLQEDEDLALLVIGGPRVDGVLWGYRKGMTGLWAYYPINGRFVHLADTVVALRDGYANGSITV